MNLVTYPWYTWAVAAIKGDYPKMRSLEWRGSTYFKLEDRSDPDKVRDYYVVYEDTKSFASCLNIKQAKTLLFFKGCDGCNSDYIFTPQTTSCIKRSADVRLWKGLLTFHTKLPIVRTVSESLRKISISRALSALIEVLRIAHIYMINVLNV